MNISAEIFPGSVSPTRLLTLSHMGRDLSDISVYQDSLRGRLPSPARDVRRSLRLPHPGLGFLRSVTHAVCPALWARSRRPTVGKPCRPAPPVTSCTSGVLPPPYLLHEEGEGGDACSVFDKRREEKPAVASTAPTCGENPYYYSNPPPLLAFLQIICSAFLPPAGVLAARVPLLLSRRPRIRQSQILPKDPLKGMRALARSSAPSRKVDLSLPRRGARPENDQHVIRRLCRGSRGARFHRHRLDR